MSTLILASIIWLALHIGVAGTRLRQVVAKPLGDQGFRAVFSIASIASISFLVIAFNHAHKTALWSAPDWLRWVLVALMAPATLLLVGSLSTISLNAVDAGTRRGPVRGILRVTRHPMMWSFGLWAFVHILAAGESAATIFFGTFLVTAFAGMPSIDRKAARRAPEAWARFAAETSILPCGAIIEGRNQFKPSELGLLVPLASVLLWAAMLVFHQTVIGIAPLAMPWIFH